MVDFLSRELAIQDPLAGRLDRRDPLSRRLQRRRSTNQSSLTPEDEQTLIRQIGGRTLGGIAAAGNLLDIPGSMIRDFITGNNPLDQLATPFSSQNRMSGRDVLRQHGLAGKQDTWGNFGGGIAFEIVADPATYGTLGLSALTKAGKVAQAAGLLNDLGKVSRGAGPRVARMTTSLGDLITSPEARQAAETAAGGAANLSRLESQRVGGLVGFRVPFVGSLGTVGPQFPGAMRAARTLDRAGEAIRYSYPVRQAARMFSAPLMEAKSQIGQQLAPELFRAKEGARAKANLLATTAATQLIKHGGHLAEPTQQASDLLRRVFENVDAAPPDLQPMVSDVQQSLTSIIPEAREWGVKINDLIDPEIGYFPRFLSTATPGSGRTFSVFHHTQNRRLDFLKGIQEGTNTIQRLARDPQIENMIRGGATTRNLANAIQNQHGHLIPATYDHIVGNTSVTSDRYMALAKWLKRLSPEVRKTGVFANHPIADLGVKAVHTYESLESSKRILSWFADPNTMQEAIRTSRTTETMPLGRVLRILKFKLGNSSGGALAKLAQLRGLPADANTLRALADTPLPKDFAEDLIRFRKGFESPEVVSDILKGLDSITNLFKAGVTSWAPAFHVRNLVSGAFQNWVAGMFSVRSMGDAREMMLGRTVKGAGSIPIVQQMAGGQVNDELGTQILRQLIQAHGVVGKYEGEFANIIGGASQTGSTLDDFMSGLPGHKPFDPMKTAAKFFARTPDTNIKPWDVRGVGGRMETGFGPIAAGEDVGYFVEGLNRISPFIEQLRRGVDPQQAAQKIGAAQVMYSNRHYTKTETEFWTRLFPFYKFSSSMVPFTLRQLWEEPGGRLAQTMRTLNSARDDSGVLPDYVAETASIPLGEQEDGSKRYLTGFGLMAEDPLSFAGSGLRGAGLELLSRTNPLIKAPLEYISGQSFFQKGPQGGRPLEDLDPVIGRTISNLTGREDPVRLPQALEMAATNSPLARGLTTLRTLSDPRKRNLLGLANVTTGFRVTDLSPAAQEAVLREEAEQQLSQFPGVRTFEKRFIPEDELARMDPETQAAAMRYQLLLRILAERAKTRAKEKKRGVARR